MHPPGRYRTPLLLILTLLLVFSVLSLSLKRSPALRKVQEMIVSMTAPGLAGLEYVGRSAKQLWQGYFYLVGVRRENAVLQRQLEEYKQREVRFQEAQQALTRLEVLLDLKRQVALPVIGARVIAYDPTLWSRSAIINQGKAQGVKEGLPVLAPQGIVGRIVAVYPEYSKVMLIVDRKSGADAMVQRTRIRGMLKGKGGNRCSLEFVPKSADVTGGRPGAGLRVGGPLSQRSGLWQGHRGQQEKSGRLSGDRGYPQRRFIHSGRGSGGESGHPHLVRTMIAPLIAFSLVGLVIFYVQNLVFFPYVHLRLLALLLFYVGLRPSLSLTLALSLVLGFLQDSYATTPFGLHLGASLVLVAMARYFRRRLLLQQLGFQVLAGLAALALQEVGLQIGTFILGYQPLFSGDLTRVHLMEILGTAALGPLMYLLVQGVETSLRRMGWRPRTEPMPYQPFGE